MFILHVLFFMLFTGSSLIFRQVVLILRLPLPSDFPSLNLICSLLSRFDLKQELRVDHNTGRVFPHNFHPSVENESMFKYIPFFFISIN